MDHLVKPYLEFILKALRYPHAIVQKHGDQLICGFTSDSSNIQKELKLFVKPKTIYKDGNNYLVIFSKNSVLEIIMIHFQRVLDRIIEQRKKSGTRGAFDIAGKYTAKHGYLLQDEAAYEAITGVPCSDLVEAGINYTYWTEATPEFKHQFSSLAIHPHPFGDHPFSVFPHKAHNILLSAPNARRQPNEITRKRYKLSVFGAEMDNFFINSLTEAQKKFLDPKETFLMGTHTRVGEKSAIRNFVSNKDLFDHRNLLPLIFSYVTKPSVQETENELLKKAIFEESKQPERKIDHEANLNNKINARILQLSNEIKSFFSLNEDRKKQKIEFLELIQLFKKANLGLSYRSCLAFAKKENPALYNAARKGTFGSATQKLLDEIAGPQREHKRSGPKSGH